MGSLAGLGLHTTLKRPADCTDGPQGPQWHEWSFVGRVDFALQCTVQPFPIHRAAPPRGPPAASPPAPALSSSALVGVPLPAPASPTAAAAAAALGPAPAKGTAASCCPFCGGAACRAATAAGCTPGRYRAFRTELKWAAAEARYGLPLAVAGPTGGSASGDACCLKGAAGGSAAGGSAALRGHPCC